MRSQHSAMDSDTLELTFNTEEYQGGDDQTLIGKVMSTKAINSKVITAVLDATWNLGSNVRFRQLDMNVVACTFTYKEDLIRIKEAGPWVVKGAIFNLQSWPSQLNLQEVDFSQCTMWVQIHNLPRNRMNEENAIRLGNYIGRYIRSAEDFHTNNVRRFLRIQVCINIAESLKTGCEIKREDGSLLKIEFRYERLPDFCYACGLVSHTITACPTPRIEGDEAKFGPWLRAKNNSPIKNRKKDRPEPTPAIGENFEKALIPRKPRTGDRHNNVSDMEEPSRKQVGPLLESSTFPPKATNTGDIDGNQLDFGLYNNHTHSMSPHKEMDLIGPSGQQENTGEPKSKSFINETSASRLMQTQPIKKTQIWFQESSPTKNFISLPHITKTISEQPTLLPLTIPADCFPQVSGKGKRKLHADSEMFKKTKLGGEEWMRECFTKLHIQSDPTTKKEEQNVAVQSVQEMVMEEKVEISRRRVIHIKMEARMKGIGNNSQTQLNTSSEAQRASRKLPSTSP